MKNTVIWSFLSVIALGTSGLVAGCDSDEKLARSGLGESCDDTASCEDSLRCVNGTCVKQVSSSGGSGNNGEGGDAPGTSGSINTGGSITNKPPVLGGEGESCTKRADCEDGLGCFAQRCQKEEAGEGGGGPVGPSLGGIGETCGLTSDCAKGLACLPQAEGNIDLKAIGSNSVGVCTQLDTNLEPSGKTCGAECLEAADCCELPIAQQTATGAASCAELAKLAGEIADCTTATGTNGLICLAFNSYCDDNCGKNTWACTNRACVYTAKCTKATQVVGGCPAYTRGGTAIPACDTKAGKCTGTPAVVTGCEADDDCADKAVADYPTDTCVDDECTCHKPTGGCYRKCAEDLDCEVGYACNDASLCVPMPGCTTDVECIRRLGDIRAVCDTELGTCGVPCEHDIDCNPGGLTNANFSQVCGPKNTCVDLGCNSDTECGEFPGGAGVRSFCAEPATPVAGAEVIHSAITD